MGRYPDVGRSPDVADIRPLRAGRARCLRLAVGGLIVAALAAGGCGGGSGSEGSDAADGSSATAASGADSSPTAAPAETGAADEPQAPAETGGDQSASEGAGGEGASANGAAVAVSADVPDLEMVDVASGSSVRLASLVTGDKPLLLWFWAPH